MALRKKTGIQRVGTMDRSSISEAKTARPQPDEESLHLFLKPPPMDLQNKEINHENVIC